MNHIPHTLIPMRKKSSAVRPWILHWTPQKYRYSFLFGFEVLPKQNCYAGFFFFSWVLLGVSIIVCELLGNITQNVMKQKNIPRTYFVARL